MFDKETFPTALPAVVNPAAAAHCAQEDARHREVEGRISALMGVINAAEGELVELTAAILDEKLGMGPGIHSPQQYLAWRTGLSSGHAYDLVRIAKRRDELPVCVAALSDGALTIDQAAMIARHVPAEFDQDATEVGARMTVSQLKRTLPRYGYGTPVRKAQPVEADPGADPDSTEPEPEAPPTCSELDPDRTVSMGCDEQGWHAHIRLPHDEGARFEHAARVTLDDLWNQHRRSGDPRSAAPTLADAVLSMAEAALDAGQAAHPGTDRYLLHLHVEQGPAGNMVVTPHLGTPFSKTIARMVTCDPTWRLVVESGGTPIGTGRTTRHISRRLRRLIEHRDGGCAVPGCGRTRGLEIHHLWHWEDGGPTETHNLLTLCKRHHRLHHQHFLAFERNPNHPAGTPGALHVRNHTGRLLDPVGTPVPLHATPCPTPDADVVVKNQGTSTGSAEPEPPDATTVEPQRESRPPPEPEPGPDSVEVETEPVEPGTPDRADVCDHAAARGIPTPTYTSPLNERIDAWGFYLGPQPTAPTRPNRWTERLAKLPPPRPPAARSVDPPART